MIDPGALGTLRIGLDHIQGEHDSTERPTAARTAHSRRDRSLTRPVAAALRWLADVIEPARRRGDLGLEG
jgi:hypothetical protein